MVWLVLDHALNPMDKGIKLVEVEEKTTDSPNQIAMEIRYDI